MREPFCFSLSGIIKCSVKGHESLTAQDAPICPDLAQQPREADNLLFLFTVRFVRQTADRQHRPSIVAMRNEAEKQRVAKNGRHVPVLKPSASETKHTKGPCLATKVCALAPNCVLIFSIE